MLIQDRFCVFCLSLNLESLMNHGELIQEDTAKLKELEK